MLGERVGKLPLSVRDRGPEPPTSEDLFQLPDLVALGNDGRAVCKFVALSAGFDM